MTETEKPVTSVQRVETELEKEASDTAAVLQDELIQAAARERQLQMQLDKMKDDVSQLQTQLDQQSSLQKKFDDLKQRSAPLWEQEIKRRDSRFINRHTYDSMLLPWQVFIDTRNASVQFCLIIIKAALYILFSDRSLSATVTPIGVKLPVMFSPFWG